jgi:hypothetical protein
MNIIENYHSLPISKLQNVRLYMQGRPLSILYRNKIKNRNHDIPDTIKLIDNELTGNYISLDCAGWYFENFTRKCTAIEINHVSLKFYKDVIFEIDYNVWRPTYLNNDPVLAYYSTYFKYSELSDFIKFCSIWGPHHKKLIIALDPSKIKFNYLKYKLIEKISEKLNFNFSIDIIKDSPFELIFMLSNKNLCAD